MIKDTGVEALSQNLAGKRVALGVCGGIGAVETVRLARELRRHGAEITVFLTPSALRFVTELSLSWASQGDVVWELGPQVEHLEGFDAVVVAPMTLSTLAKCALGISDNPVTLLVASHLGSGRPLVFVPAMNLQMAGHPLYGEYSQRLRGWGARFYTSPEAEGRLKMPDPRDLVAWLVEVILGH